jgi:peroxiredoxin
VPTSSPARSVKERPGEMTANIPEAVGSRIDTCVSEIAAAGVARGLVVGDQAAEFTLPDALGRPVRLAQLLARRPAPVTLYRGEGNPFCNIQLQALQAALPSFLELGGSLVAISPQAANHSLSLTEKHEPAFPVLAISTKR